MASSVANHRLFIGGTWRDGATSAELRAPWDGHVVARVQHADARAMEEAIAAADAAFASFRRTSRFLRSRLLAAMARGLEQNRGALVEAICNVTNPVDLSR